MTKVYRLYLFVDSLRNILWLRVCYLE